MTTKTGTRAAIYARKSTKDDKELAVGRQEDDARAFIETRGWSLDDWHVYKDNNKSGALFRGRPEFQRMLTDAKRGAFDVVVLFDLDRFGRHAQKSMEALNELADAGVEVYDCSTGQPVDLESFEGETNTYLKARFAQQYREQIRKHTRAAMRKKALQGKHTHGPVYGYDVVRIGKGDCELRINERQANVVRDIYTRAADGEGARTIAAALNRTGVPKPRAQQGRKDGWSVSTIRAVLKRPLYRGEIVYGRTQKAYGRELKKVYRNTQREKGQIRKSEDTWIRVTDPAVEQRLRIVDPDLAERVDARLQDRRERYLASVKRPDGLRPHKAHGKYLLSGGMLICPSCGGHFEARKYPWKPSPETAKRLPKHARVGHPGQVYICSTRRRKPGVCTNTLALPIDETDDTVLDIIEGEVLGSRFIRELLGLVDRGEVDDTVHLTAERDRLRGEVDNLVKSIAAGVPPDTVAPAITERESQIAALEARLRRPRQVPPDLVRLKAALEQRAKDWKRDLRAEPQVARMVVRRLVAPIVLHDESTRPEWVKWETEPTTGLLEGLAPMPTLLVASPRGNARFFASEIRRSLRDAA